MKKLLLSFVLCVFLVAEAQAQSLRASVNRTTLPEGETLVLNVDYDGKDTNEKPDFSALEQNFKIYSQGQSFLTNIINGKMSQTRQWNLVLIPKLKGQIIIPSFTLGQLKSDPITINVVNAAAAAQPQSGTEDMAPRFAFKAKASPLTPYVQQQVNLELTLLDTGGFQGEMPVFEGDEAKDWTIKLLKEPTVATKVVNGKSLREIKFYYALFPQKSGDLIIPKASINGYYLTKSNRRNRDPFADLFGDDLVGMGFGFSDMFANRNPVYLTTEPIKVQVKAMPQNASGWWIPAGDLKLFSEWNPEKPVFRVGDAVSRTVYLRATGVIDTQLPDIKFAALEGMKQYPEKPLAEAKVENGEIVAIKKAANVYIPTKAGKMTIPAVTVRWFDINRQEFATATLPATEIEVLPAIGGNEASQPALETTDTASQPENLPAPEQPAPQPSPNNTWQVYLWIAAAFVAGILLSYLLFRPKASGADKSVGALTKLILAAAKSKDIRALRDHLIEWARKYFHDENISNLKQVSDYVKDKDFEAEVNKLAAALYSEEGKNWHGKDFLTAFEKICKNKRKSKDQEQLLPKLYK